MAYYNLTNLTEASNMVVMAQEVNRLSGYIFGILIMIAIFVILIVAFRNVSIRSSLPITFFICTLLSTLLSVMQLLPDFSVYILAIATAGSVLASIFINPAG